MVKLKNPLFSFLAKGKCASVALVNRRRQNIAEKIPVVPDAKSLAQLSWRHMYQKAVALWHGLSAAEKAEWESQARPKHMTGFAWFMSQALRPNPGLYLPLQGGTMQGIIDMNGHKIEDLPDPLAAQEPVTRQFFEDNLPVGGYTEGARVYHNAAQSIPHATITVLAFNSERYDTDAIHDPVTNNSRLTAKTAGKYVISANVLYAPHSTGVRYLRIRLNGAIYIAMVRDDAIAAPETSDLSVTTIYSLSVNDYVEVIVYQTRGGALNVLSVSEHSPEFSMQRVG